jgi:SMC interacting uncharacterized protein involved in chromosome segregation
MLGKEKMRNRELQAGLSEHSSTASMLKLKDERIHTIEKALLKQQQRIVGHEEEIKRLKQIEAEMKPRILNTEKMMKELEEMRKERHELSSKLHYLKTANISIGQKDQELLKLRADDAHLRRTNTAFAGD